METQRSVNKGSSGVRYIFVETLTLPNPPLHSSILAPQISGLSPETSPIRLTGIMFAGYTLRVLSDLYRLCHPVVFSKGIQLDCPSFESRYATHWVER
uniref:Uncharacterized protein n=1 Tax=Salix viminalis TaxID=40686 RepID=A0A6N2L8C5_SALVM